MPSESFIFHETEESFLRFDFCQILVYFLGIGYQIKKIESWTDI